MNSPYGETTNEGTLCTIEPVAVIIRASTIGQTGGCVRFKIATIITA